MVKSAQPKFLVMEQGTAINVTQVQLTISGVRVVNIPIVNNQLGFRIGATLANKIAHSSLAVKDAVDMVQVLIETGPKVEDALEVGFKAAWFGNIEEAAKRLAFGLSSLFATILSAIALRVLDLGESTNMQKISKSDDVNVWIDNLPRAVSNSLVVAQKFQMKPEQLQNLIALSVNSLALTRGAHGKRLLIARVSRYGVSNANPANPDATLAAQDLTEIGLIERALNRYSKAPLQCPGPFLYGMLGTERERVDNVTAPRAGAMLPPTETVLVAIEQKLFMLTWPDVADFFHATLKYGAQFPWAAEAAKKDR